MSFNNNPSWTNALSVIMADAHVNNDVPKNMQKLKKASTEQLKSLITYRHGISNPANFILNFLQPFRKGYSALLIIDEEDTNKTYLETLKGIKLMELTRSENGKLKNDQPIVHHDDSIIINLSEHSLQLGRWSLFKLSVFTAFLRTRYNPARKEIK